MQFHGKIEDILSQSQKSLVEVYFELQTLCEQIYGKNAVVVMEVGSFYEVYGVDTEELTIGKPKEIAEVLNLQLTRRNKHIAENSVKNPLLCGFPIATFDRYISRLVQENKYTIAIVRQRGEPPTIERYLDRILSPGVNFDYTVDHDENLIASLCVDVAQGVYTVGYAAIDVTTGTSYTFECQSSKEDPTSALDQLFAVVHTHRTSEMVITPMHEHVSIPEVLQYLELLDNENVHINNARNSIAYQNELFKQSFAIESFLSPIEFLDLETTPLASEALTVVIDFVIGHEYSIMKKLRMPVSIEQRNFLYLGNNPLEQLNIISRDPHEFTLLKFIDHTRTSMGKRLLKDRLLHPIIDAHRIESRYDLAESVRPIYKDIDQHLKSVYDLERMLRRIQLGRLHPFEINFLYDSLVAALACIHTIERTPTNTTLREMIQKKEELLDAIGYLDHTFILSQTSGMALSTIDGSFFQRGVNKTLDELIEKEDHAYSKLVTIKEKILEILEEETGKPEPEYVQIKQLDKEGHYINMTKSRYALIQQQLKKTFVSIDGTVYSLGDFHYKIQTTNVKITADIIDDISSEVSIVQSKIRAEVRALFVNELSLIEEKFGDLFLYTVRFLAELDVAVSTIISAIELRLTRPEIIDTAGHEPFLELDTLRHPLVEAREENGLYVPNDVVLGQKKYATINSVISDSSTDTVRGVLLYGINSSGKSSLMKSIGIAVIMAQAGLYVPAKHMRLSLFKELFTRIVAKDNFERGLSSFAVEMMELKHIFTHCSPNSLLLGDEISHGTETRSSLAIVMATMLRLSQTGCLFVFTTHLHQLQQLPQMKQLPHVVSVHLSVSYDEGRDTLVFNRTLQPGSGSSIYGLEFAQSLHMDESFLQNAMKIRRELAGELDSLELLTKKQTSLYNNDVYLTCCSLCNNMVKETHHNSPANAGR